MGVNNYNQENIPDLENIPSKYKRELAKIYKKNVKKNGGVIKYEELTPERVKEIVRKELNEKEHKNEAARNVEKNLDILKGETDKEKRKQLKADIKLGKEIRAEQKLNEKEIQYKIQNSFINNKKYIDHPGTITDIYSYLYQTDREKQEIPAYELSYDSNYDLNAYIYQKNDFNVDSYIRHHYAATAYLNQQKKYIEDHDLDSSGQINYKRSEFALATALPEVLKKKKNVKLIIPLLTLFMITLPYTIIRFIYFAFVYGYNSIRTIYDGYGSCHARTYCYADEKYSKRHILNVALLGFLIFIALTAPIYKAYNGEIVSRTTIPYLFDAIIGIIVCCFVTKIMVRFIRNVHLKKLTTLNLFFDIRLRNHYYETEDNTITCPLFPKYSKPFAFTAVDNYINPMVNFASMRYLNPFVYYVYLLMYGYNVPIAYLKTGKLIEFSKYKI